jgi:hypothetical protein
MPACHNEFMLACKQSSRFSAAAHGVTVAQPALDRELLGLFGVLPAFKKLVVRTVPGDPMRPHSRNSVYSPNRVGERRTT